MTHPARWRMVTAHQPASVRCCAERLTAHDVVAGGHATAVASFAYVGDVRASLPSAQRRHSQPWITPAVLYEPSKTWHCVRHPGSPALAVTMPSLRRLIQHRDRKST